MTTAAKAGARESELARLLRQIEAIERWNATRWQRGLLPGPAGEGTSAGRLSADDVVGRAQRALQEQTVSSLTSTGWPMLDWSPVTAVIAHRHAWFSTALTRALAEHDVTVVATTDNGADALGMVVAEQPDVLLVGESLDTLAGRHLLTQATVFARSTLLAAHVGCREDAPAMLHAGAHTAFTRGVPPADVAEALTALVLRQSAALASAG